MFRRDLLSASNLIEEGIPLMKKEGFGMLEESERALELIALAIQGKINEFISRSREARKYSTIEFQIRQTWVRSVLAEAFTKAGKLKIADSLLDQASELMERNGERYVESEIYRIRGELIVAQTEAGEDPASRVGAKKAEEVLMKAVESARASGAKILELRAAISLCRLLQKQGRAKAAFQMLSELCAQFSEGFEAPELKTAHRAA